MRHGVHERSPVIFAMCLQSLLCGTPSHGALYTPERSSAWIEDAVPGDSVHVDALKKNAVSRLLVAGVEVIEDVVAAITLLSNRIGVMLDVELPGQRLVLAGKGVQGRNLAGQRLGRAAGLENQDTKSGFAQVCRDRSPPAPEPTTM
jgi:hypothetical protein